jgi:AcrR family transcriptional regulator
MSKKQSPILTDNGTDQSTERRIIDAAQKVFIKKGYAATTREIADEAGINNGLLNYYFRSKEKLFDLVMKEQIAKLFGLIFPIVNDASTTLSEKITLIVNTYTELLLDQPGLVLFVLSEFQNQPGRFSPLIDANGGLMQSVIVRQIREARPDLDPIQVSMTILGMILFPFIGRPVFQGTQSADKAAFDELLKARTKTLPTVILSILRK